MPLPWTRYLVAEHSMSPTLESGDCIVVSRRRPVHRGSIVVYDTDTMTMVKRVIGLPGESVRIEGGIVTVDGDPEPSPVWEGATRPEGQWTIGHDEVFVLGDHRRQSAGDSRERGPVPLASITGVVSWRYWPAPRRFSAPPTPPNAAGAGGRSV